jgi:hypothetical protein
MKKFVGGCFVIAVLAGVAVGVALYFGYRAMSPMIDNASAMLQRAKDAAAQSDRLENKSRYTPPSDGTLTEAQVRRFLAVHERTRQTLGARWDELQAQADRIEQQAKQDARELSFADVAAMLGSLGGLIVEARRAHVDALNAEQFSASEYNWVKLRAYEAAGLEAMDGIDWASIEEAIEQGASRIGVRDPKLPDVPKPQVPERNRELAKPHYDELKAWLPLTVLGF